MKAGIYYGVQFAQSRYLLLRQSGQQSSIVDEVFASGDELSVCYGVATCAGRAAVQHYFAAAEEAQNTGEGSFRDDAPATQFIDVAPNETSATGHWTTMTCMILKAGNENESSLLKYSIGRYTNNFEQDNGVWRLRHVRWTPVLEILPWRLEQDTALENHCAAPRKWVDLPPHLQPVATEGALPKTTQSLCVRNTVMAFCNEYNRCGVKAITDTVFSREAGQAARRMLAHTVAGIPGQLLATSPVVVIDDKLSGAELFMSAAFIKPVGSTEVEHQRGSIRVRLERYAENRWHIVNYEWFRYASLAPWTISKQGEKYNEQVFA